MSVVSLKDQITADMKSAMKSREVSRLGALKLISADCKNQEIMFKKPLTDEQTVRILKKHIKQYEESIAQYEQAGRGEAVIEQKARLKHVRSYLPKELSLDELKILIEDSTARLKPDSIKQMGLVIKDVQKRSLGRADNRLLAQLVRERLQAL